MHGSPLADGEPDPVSIEGCSSHIEQNQQAVKCQQAYHESKFIVRLATRTDACRSIALTPEVVSKVIVGIALCVRVQEGHLVLHGLVRRGCGGVAGVGVSVEDEPEVRSYPLVQVLLSSLLDQLPCGHQHNTVTTGSGKLLQIMPITPNNATPIF